jgi:D-arabinono-1,4-lactone oxidase
VPCDNGKPPQTFWDSWINALPNDTHEYGNNLLTAYRAEFWIPMDQATQAMSVLNNYYQHQYFPDSNPENRNAANGCYVVEVLGAKSTPFWLSPSYNQDCLRINFYSLKETQDDVMDYFQQFWDLFYNNKINFRMHWGYILPPPSSSEGGKYLPNQYPMWPQFLNLRESMDPHNLFVNTYWKEQLNLF